MIPQAFINEWRQFAPWSNEAQIEQDLILSRAIIEIFSHPFLKEVLVFRGGTALNKLFIHPASRYSEDIDLVQINEGPIGPIMEALHEQLYYDNEAGKGKLNALIERYNASQRLGVGNNHQPRLKIFYFI